MKKVILTPGTALPSPCVATIGFFDGVHRGHRYLIGHVCELARKHGLEAAVVTFDSHPRQVLHADYTPQLLSTPEEKIALLARTGIDTCAILPFDTATAALSAHDFMAGVLKERLNARILVTGYDNRFGHNRAEGFDDYVRYGRELGIDVERWQPMEVGGVNVSSSVVRSLLQAGEVEMAARCLGYRYTINGTVVSGRHMGNSIGFPTANIEPACLQKLVPGGGVYAVEAFIEGEEKPRPAMLNIGSRPTFDNGQVTIECHIIDYQGDLYGTTLSVAFVARLRDERKFRTAAELACQLRHDMEEAVARFNAINQ